MKTASPLRYPGGKAALTGLLAGIRALNCLRGYSIAEPFAGGAGASLELLYLEEADAIYINDADPAIYDFWWSMINQPRQFAALLAKTRVSMTEWRRQRDVYRSERRTSKLRRGFASFYLNRCNRSGIIMNGGPIGGVRQTGRWKLGARFNKTELRARCAKVAEYRERIHVSCMDGVEFIRTRDLDSTFLFIDPPYYKKGPLLYLNALNETYHQALAQTLKRIQHAAWVLTYDDCPAIRRMYRGWTKMRAFSTRYTAAQRQMGRELLIAPSWMQLPTRQSSLAVDW